ncbi:ketopantoate reductase family protein [Marinomonas profundimaris]|jgi:2-dehydropantoate 2-reductase|uniref:2-dehydropantoate 2-reductase n=1 Tax=Marinomonas profundimaris TaxID=1208321 RepID=W1RZ20_9GAMM|nr:2-dehydropantoate 2-reductase [Marinomonas profundimaris]ETI62055.1 2-dehydropantoate 2-reductase [Marinomonas profundimaris]
MKNTPWLVIGAGAIGLFWACKLEELGYKVHLVYRSENPGKKITLESLTNENGDQQITVSKHKIKSVAASELTDTYDKVLLCTKSFDLKNAFLQVAQHITDDANIACLCNGIGAQEELQNALSENQTLWAGTTSEGVLKIEPNHIKHTGLGDTYFGEWQPSIPAKAFPIDGLTVTNIHQRMIEKLAVNAVINPITAIFSIHNGDILNDEFKPLVNATLSELASVFSHPKFSYADQSQHLTPENLKNRVNTIAQLTRLNRSSMHEDIRLQRQTENSFISGFLLNNSPIDLPIQQLLYNGVAFPEQREETQKKLLSIT